MDIIVGLIYLETNNILHVDISANRLLVLTEPTGHTVKIADYGYHMLVKQDLRKPIPVSWTAPVRC